MGTNGVSPEECKFLQVEHRTSYTIYNMRFGSIGEIELFLRSNPDRNRNAFAEYSSEKASIEFAGPPLEQAIRTLVDGYEENYDQFLMLAKQLESVNRKYVVSRKAESAFVGQRPNVPAYVAGAPKTMYRLRKMEAKKHINIFMNLAYTWNTSTEQIRHRGIIVLNLIRMLELNNYIVNFRAFEACIVRDEVFVCEVVLKKPGELLNPRLCYYPMCGKGFLRRILFRVKESMPFVHSWGSMNYGSILTEKYMKNILQIHDADIYIGAPIEMGIKGFNIYKDADTFFERLKLRDKIVVPVYHEEAAGGKNNA